MIILTSWNSTGRTLYGETFLRTFDQFWPQDAQLWVFEEGPVRQTSALDARIQFFDFYGVDEWKAVSQEWPKNETFFRRIRGVPSDSGGIAYTQKEFLAGYSYRFDAWKFCRKVFVMAYAARWAPMNQTLVWLDGDTVTRAIIPKNFEDIILPPEDPYQFAYLGRDAKHSETGFLMFKPTVRRYIQQMAEFYTSGRVFQELTRGWTDSEVFDHVFLKTNLLVGRNLSRPPRKGAVFEPSILGRYMTHLKGDRKLRA